MESRKMNGEIESCWSDADSVIFSGFCHPEQPSVFVTLHTLIQPATLAFIPRLITVQASAHTSCSWQEALRSATASLPLCCLCPCFSYSSSFSFFIPTTSFFESVYFFLPAMLLLAITRLYFHNSVVSFISLSSTLLLLSLLFS